MSVTKSCAFCDLPFTRAPAVARKEKCCSKACRKALGEKRRQVTCARCKVVFLRTQTVQKFCSPACAVHLGERSVPPPTAIPGATWIPLAGNKFALVDDADAVLVMGHRWSVRGGYAATNIDGKCVRMHALLAGPWLDHENLDRLDNRRGNLRQANHAQNGANRHRLSNNTSGFKGVSRHGKKWSARLGSGIGRTYLGQFDTPEEAGAAYDRAASAMHGEFARTNAMENGR